MACRNNLEWIGRALYSYYAAYGTYPPAYTTDKDGKPLHSWRVLILPYMHEERLYNEIRLDEPWNSPHNAALAKSMPPIFRCPSESKSLSWSETSYFLLTGPGTVFEGGKAPRSDDFEKGLSNRAILVEASGQGVNWMEPRDLDLSQLDTLKSAHPHTVNVGFADREVRSLETETVAEELKSLSKAR